MRDEAAAQQRCPGFWELVVDPLEDAPWLYRHHWHVLLSVQLEATSSKAWKRPSCRPMALIELEGVSFTGRSFSALSA